MRLMGPPHRRSGRLITLPALALAAIFLLVSLTGVAFREQASSLFEQARSASQTAPEAKEPQSAAEAETDRSVTSPPLPDAAESRAAQDGRSPAAPAALPITQAPAPRATGALPATSGAAVSPVLPPLPSADRMIVKTGSLSLQVSDLAAAVQQTSSVLAGMPGAYIAASTTYYRVATPAATGARAGLVASPGELPVLPSQPPRPVPAGGQTLGQSASLTIKVPADAFGETLQRLRELGTPLAENVSTQEVTEEFVDLEAQVRNLEATEQQYLRFLERAQRIEEILPLQQRITEVRGQIERLRGRINLLQRRADSSTITLSLFLPPGKAGGQPGAEPRLVRTLREALTHVGVALEWLLVVAIYLGVYAIPLLPLLVAYWWWRGRRATPGAGAPSPGGAM